MIRPGLMALAASVTLTAGCEDMFSLTEARELGSFEVPVTLPAAHQALKAQAERRGLEVLRDKNPRDQAIPSDYFASVGEGRCLLTVQGSRAAQSETVKVWLGEAAPSACGENMRELFTSLRKNLQANRG